MLRLVLAGTRHECAAEPTSRHNNEQCVLRTLKGRKIEYVSGFFAPLEGRAPLSSWCFHSAVVVKSLYVARLLVPAGETNLHRRTRR